MAKIEEKMLQMVVDMAAKGGKMEAQQEAQDKEIERLMEEIRQLKAERAKDKERISELEQLLQQQQASRPQVVVNNYNFFMLSVPRTRAYVDNLAFAEYRSRMNHVIDPSDVGSRVAWRKSSEGWYIPEGYIFPLGDNRDNSRDGRYFGPVQKSKVLGQAFIIYWPFGRAGIVR